MASATVLARIYAGVLAFLVWLAGVVTVTLFPWDFGAPTGTAFAFEWRHLLDVRNVVSNVLLFVPLGVVLHREGERRSAAPVAILMISAVGGLLVTSTVELLQMSLPQRDSSLVDVLSNVSGAVLGVLCRQSWVSTFGVGAARIDACASPRLLIGVVAVFTGVALVTSGALQLRTRLSNWDIGYPLLVGNEHTGDRPWRGRIFAFEMTDRATPPASVRRFASGAPVGVPGATLARFDFSGLPPYEDAAGNLPPLARKYHRPSSAAGPGTRLTRRSWLRTAGPAAGIAHRVGESNAFSLRVRCATDDPAQRGPARIITNSPDTATRNFTLGQQGSDAVFRFRTPHTGPNGYRPEIVVPGVFVTTQPREILVTYDGATLLVAVGGSGHVSRSPLTPGSSLGVAMTSLDVPDHALRVFDIAYTVGLFLAGGLLIGRAALTTRRRLAIGYSWVVALSLLLESAIVFASGRSFDWADAAGNACLGAIVMTAIAATGFMAASRAGGRLDQRAWSSCG